MTGPADDWQERIESGRSFYPDFEEQYPPKPDPVFPPHPAAGGPRDFASPGATQQFPAVPGYGYPPADAGAPFGRDPVTGEPLSDKSRLAGGLLQVLLPFAGICGVGRIYIGSTTIGLIQLLGMFVAMFMSLLLIGIPFMIAIWFWSVIDGILMLAGNVRDPYGRKLRS
ncbi:TM2 domain-containing protein [Rhodococcus gannanensis]|uniref:TM2 domain-containing protein n=1 Tax=Rhodococcus gannanensis TaxID=1960308 RepID=A0ABW4P380_9NOCA